MTQNVVQLWPQILWLAGGALALLIFGLAISLPPRLHRLPASSGHRAEGDHGEHEEIHADGYIDSFSNEIEEAGGGLPLVVKIALPGVLACWLLYLILYWNPK